MFRATPVLNLHLQKKWEQKQLDRHKDKIRNVKSSLDHRSVSNTGEIKRFGVNSKKDALVERKFRPV